jgi:hypothetical protein
VRFSWISALRTEAGHTQRAASRLIPIEVSTSPTKSPMTRHAAKLYRGQNRPIKTHSFVGDEIVKVSLESAVSKARPSQLILAKTAKRKPT